jgi:Rieske Fe-S protein
MDDEQPHEPADPAQPVEPVWKRDFPYESAGEDEVTRREFARYLVAGAGVMAAGNVGIAAWTQLRTINTGEPRRVIPLADVAVGATHLFRYPTEADPAILLRLGEREVVAFSQKCTHLGCVVYFEAEEDRWHCPCHEGNFEPRTGAVISGPPPRPLGRIAVEIRDDAIWALGYQP